MISLYHLERIPMRNATPISLGLSPQSPQFWGWRSPSILSLRCILDLDLIHMFLSSMLCVSMKKWPLLGPGGLGSIKLSAD